MKKLMKLNEIVMKLIGPVQPTGSHGTDAERLDNIIELARLIDQLLFEIHEASRSANSHEASMKSIGTYAHEFLTELRSSDYP